MCVYVMNIKLNQVKSNYNISFILDLQKKYIIFVYKYIKNISEKKAKENAMGS